MNVATSDNRRMSSGSGCFDCFNWLPKKMQDSRSEWRRIFPTDWSLPHFLASITPSVLHKSIADTFMFLSVFLVL